MSAFAAVFSTITQAYFRWVKEPKGLNGSKKSCGLAKRRPHTRNRHVQVSYTYVSVDKPPSSLHATDRQAI